MEIHYPFLSPPSSPLPLSSAKLGAAKKFASFFQITQHGAENTPTSYKYIINFCSLGSFSVFFIIVLVADGEEKYSGKVFLALVFC